MKWKETNFFSCLLEIHFMNFFSRIFHFIFAGIFLPLLFLVVAARYNVKCYVTHWEIWDDKECKRTHKMTAHIYPSLSHSFTQPLSSNSFYHHQKKRIVKILCYYLIKRFTFFCHQCNWNFVIERIQVFIHSFILL